MCEFLILSIKNLIKKFEKKADFFMPFFQKSCYLMLPKSCYLTSYLRVEVTRGDQKKKHARTWVSLGLFTKKTPLKKTPY